VPLVEDGASGVERLLAIKALPLFADVHADELAVIAERTRVHEFRPGDTVVANEDGPIASMHLVLEGRVTEYRNGELFRVHESLRVVGGVDALARTATAVRAVADVATRTLAIDRADLRDILEDNFNVLSVALRGVAAATVRLRRRLFPSAGFEAGGGDEVRHALAPALDELGARIAFLRRTTLGRAKIRTLGLLARDAELLDLGAGESLWKSEHAADHALVVVRGVVACTTVDGRQRFALGPETIAGLEETLAEAPRWYDATAREAVTAMRLTRAAIADALEDDSDMALDALAALATVASELRDRVAREGTGDA